MKKKNFTDYQYGMTTFLWENKPDSGGIIITKHIIHFLPLKLSGKLLYSEFTNIMF